MEKGYSASLAKKVSGVTQRCLDYWDERGIVRPSMGSASGKGSQRRYSFEDLVKLAVVKELRDAGLSLQRIQRAVRILRKRSLSKDPLSAAKLITDGQTVFRLTEEAGVVEDVLAKGQLVLSVVAVGQIQGRLHQHIVRIEKQTQRRARHRSLRQG